MSADDHPQCGPSIHIDGADDGAPTMAHCDCGWTWTRPDGDRWADTLPSAARAHRMQSNVETG